MSRNRIREALEKLKSESMPLKQQMNKTIVINLVSYLCFIQQCDDEDQRNFFFGALMILVDALNE